MQYAESHYVEAPERLRGFWPREGCEEGECKEDPDYIAGRKNA
jgi:hypothetical protein